MTGPIDDIRFHDNNFMVALAKHIGLDPAQITDMVATGERDGDEVLVTWSGYATVDIDSFNEILARVDDSKVVRGQ